MDSDIQFNDGLERQIWDIVEKYPKHWAKMLKSRGFNGRYPDRTRLFEYIQKCTPFLDGSMHTFKTRVFCVLNRLTDFPLCENRTARLHRITQKNVRNLRVGFGKYCCSDCQHADPGYFLKIRESFKEKYGVVNPFQLESVKAGLAENKDDIQRARDRTKRLNNTFGKSGQEDDIYGMLAGKFGKDDVVRQYKSEKYPFSCDFYIRSRDLYIECNFNWTHGGKFFDENSATDTGRLEIWKQKALTSDFYMNAVRTWSVRDVLKLKTARGNALRYLVFWTVDEAKA